MRFGKKQKKKLSKENGKKMGTVLFFLNSQQKTVRKLRKNRTVPDLILLFFILLSENKASFYKFVDISIEDSIHVTDFVLSSQVFNHLVGM
jgi:hypothetical protein